jgi:hypothetical protein
LRRSIALILALSFAALGLPGAASAASLPSGFWGVVANEAPSTSTAETLAGGGVESVRVAINWSAVQSSEGAEPNWGTVDPTVRAAAEAGLSVLPFIAVPPEWAVPYESIGGGSKAPRSLPVQTSAQRLAWREFLRRAVYRYGPGGSFWAENPLLPAHPVRIWQIWNEENFKYFAARPSPSQYGQLVTQSYADLRSADSGARIVLGGMFGEPKNGSHPAKAGQIKRSYFASDFLERMYRTTPGVRGKFIAVALHPYVYSYKQLTREVDALREVLKKEKDPGRALWITEMGWSSDKPSASNGKNGYEKGSNQTREMAGAFKLLEANAAAWRVKRVYWFSLTDAPGSCNFCDGSGLFTREWEPKAAWSTYRRFAR